MLFGVLLFFGYRGSQPQEAQLPPDSERVIVNGQVHEEGEAAVAENEQPAPAPAGALAEEPRPSARSSGVGGGSDAAQGGGLPAALKSVHVVSVGYSPQPSNRVVALRIGGSLPYILHEGDTIGDMKILAILNDRVQVKQNGKTYEITAR